jgi:hypothetical protein
MVQAVAGSRTGYQYSALTQAGDSFQTDRVHSVSEIRFFTSTTQLSITVRIGCEGMDLFGGQSVPLGILQSRVSTLNHNGATTAGYVCVFRPERPIRWDPSFPIVIVPSADVSVAIFGEPDLGK